MFQQRRGNSHVRSTLKPNMINAIDARPSRKSRPLAYSVPLAARLLAQSTRQCNARNRSTRARAHTGRTFRSNVDADPS